MELANNLLIAVDAGHGGYDSGASHNGRLEKDDNLRLAREVQKQLEAQGIGVLMTRTDDTSVSFQDRARIANEADADLFVSLHRNSYIEQTPASGGVGAAVYLTAPAASTAAAAEALLKEIADIGAQNNRGVRRGNFYILRKTKMPAILLEMGFITDDADNRLFDENLARYSSAIAKGIMRYFEIPVNADPTPDAAPPADLPAEPFSMPSVSIPPEPAPLPPIPPLPAQPPAMQDIKPPPVVVNAPPSSAGQRVIAAQKALNDRYGFMLDSSGQYDRATRSAAIMALQSEINRIYGKNLPVDGVLDDATRAAIPTIAPNSPSELIFLLQVMLMLNGYDVGVIDGVNGPTTRTMIQLFQRDFYLIPNGMVEPKMTMMMLESRQ